MVVHSDDFERFGIAPDDPFASHRLQCACFLSERGVGDDEIRRDSSIPALELRAWALIFLRSDKLTGLQPAAASVGFDPDEAVRITRLLGFADSDRLQITAEDVALMRELETFAQLFGTSEGDQLIRLIGSFLARLAEGLAGAARITQETPMLENATYLDFLRAADTVIGGQFPRLAVMIDRILRYHLLALSTQSWSVDPDMAVMTMPRAVGFADMVGFTTRAGALSTGDLSVVIEAFEGRVSEAITMNGGRAVKFIGDEVLFAFSDPDAACACALELLALARDDAIPDVRVGMAFGDVVSRGGDYYGPVVNVASRLVDSAEPGTALVTKELADLSTAHRFEMLPPRELKGVAGAVAYARLTFALKVDGP